MTAYVDAIAEPPRTLTELEQKLLLKVVAVMPGAARAASTEAA